MRPFEDLREVSTLIQEHTGYFVALVIPSCLPQNNRDLRFIVDACRRADINDGDKLIGGDRGLVHDAGDVRRCWGATSFVSTGEGE